MATKESKLKRKIKVEPDQECDISVKKIKLEPDWSSEEDEIGFKQEVLKEICRIKSSKSMYCYRSSICYKIIAMHVQQIKYAVLFISIYEVTQDKTVLICLITFGDITVLECILKFLRNLSVSFTNY